MDFEFTKENILPLVGGRNAQQLGMALQAQNNRESQLELLQQKEQWEAQIKSYTGDDPLDNFYKYISWIEQIYPKHGHEGNIVSLLEHCLKLFEDDKRYVNDQRFCKLWIKYFDLQSNPLELYHMMQAKGLCTGVTDFYKAWAFYHEAREDFQAANKVFEEGKRRLAQPFDDLENAHQNLITAAGQFLLYGRNESRLMEKRQALTSLHTYKSGRVGSIRVPSSNGLVTVPSSSSSSSRSNNMIAVHQDRPGEASLAIDEAPPVSIITVAKRQELPKENTLKAGPWTGTVPVKKRVIGCGGLNVAAGFVVHEDISEQQLQQGINLPKNYPKTTLEDYSDWHVAVSNPDPLNPAERPMYPKHLVYGEPNTEYSLEEIRSRRYIPRQIDQQPITIDDDEIEIVQETIVKPVTHLSPQKPIFHQSPVGKQFGRHPIRPSSKQKQQQHSPMQTQQVSPMQFPHKLSPIQNQQSLMQTQQSPMQEQLSPMQTQLSPMPNNLLVGDGGLGAAQTNFSLWQSPEVSQHVAPTPFGIFEESFAQNQPKGKAMQTALKVLNADELAETGSRGGMDNAVTAQTMDSAKELADETLSTTVFFDLNAMQVSTPQTKESAFHNVSLDEDQLMSSKKQLFSEPNNRDAEVLSTIFEETKSSNGSSGNCNMANQLPTMSEEHNNYLVQNMMANAELRSSLLGNLMDIGPPPQSLMHEEDNQMVSNQNAMHVTTFDTTMRDIPAPAKVKPLDFIPSDPFRSQLISQLLERVSFPGPHSYGYIDISVIPRLCIKREVTCIGGERYILEKQLGKGTFGTVYKALDLGNNITVAMKYQKPANKWEFYICRELQSRLAKHPLRDRFMDIPLAYFSDQASLIISEYMPGGSLLDLANMHKQKQGKTMKECLVIYFCIQMLRIVQAMHQVQIIHADIKPDNFLIFIAPDNSVVLQLIDFGCSIDMSLFPPNTAFRRHVTTEDFICCEMLDNRPWNYHTDLFCVAATTHVLLFDTYIKLQKKDNLWSIQQRFPRYLKVDLWNMFFGTFLNQQTGPADAASLLVLFDETLDILNKDTGSSLPSQIRYIVNLLKNR